MDSTPTAGRSTIRSAARRAAMGRQPRQNKLSSFSGTTKTVSHASRGSNTLGGAAKITIRMATTRAVGREPGNYDVRLAAEDFEWAAELVRIAGDILVKETPSEMEVDLTRGEMVKES
jgi:hypothetical protein